MIEFTITDNARQQFSTILDGRRVTIELWYAPASDRWSMSLAMDGENVLSGIRVVGGVDLLKPFNLGIGVLFVWSPAGLTAPGRDDLPLGNVRFFSATQEEVDAAVVKEGAGDF